jgi:hypothetical protein
MIANVENLVGGQKRQGNLVGRSFTVERLVALHDDIRAACRIKLVANNENENEKGKQKK